MTCDQLLMLLFSGENEVGISTQRLVSQLFCYILSSENFTVFNSHLTDKVIIKCINVYKCYVI
jgi:hypothetical protein